MLAIHRIVHRSNILMQHNLTNVIIIMSCEKNTMSGDRSMEFMHTDSTNSSGLTRISNRNSNAPSNKQYFTVNQQNTWLNPHHMCVDTDSSSSSCNNQENLYAPPNKSQNKTTKENIYHTYTDANSPTSSRINQNNIIVPNNTQYCPVSQPNLMLNPHSYHGLTAFGFSSYAYDNQPQLIQLPDSMMYRSFSDTSVFHHKPSLFHRQNSDSAISCKTRKKGSKVLSLRNWESAGQNSTKEGFNFKLMSYNVLAQKLIEYHPYLYKNHDQGCLQWKSRFEKIINEIESVNPDIICLQEVQKSHINHYNSKLHSAGYKGLYKKRTRQCPDGCAIYYKANVLNMVENITVEYHQSEWTLLNRDNIAIIARFAPKNNPDEEFIVATTHLLYNPKREDVRLAQVQILLTEVERMAFKAIIKGKYTYLPTIITGDLNTSPYSNVYHFITDGMISLNGFNGFQSGVIPPSLKITDNCQHAALLRIRESEETISRMKELTMIELLNSDNVIEKIKNEEVDLTLFSSGHISHNFPLKSVYKHFTGNGNEATTFQDKWLTVDYIFYSGKKNNGNIVEDKLKLIQRYSLPLDCQLGGVHIPNHDVGSDHLSLAAMFKLVF